jgi:hypothetical protein
MPNLLVNNWTTCTFVEQQTQSLLPEKAAVTGNAK